MIFNKKILFSIFLLMMSTFHYSFCQFYTFQTGEVAAEGSDDFYSGQNPLYVDKSLLAVDQVLNQVEVIIKNRGLDPYSPAGRFIYYFSFSLAYGYSLPILHCQDFYRYPSYQTFS